MKRKRSRSADEILRDFADYSTVAELCRAVARLESRPSTARIAFVLSVLRREQRSRWRRVVRRPNFEPHPAWTDGYSVSSPF